ncbi:hypothetical protein GCM10023220_21280 [Streptomyces ziwulingensis]|uniref:Uncharacterized protein n=1 Tax=Streptomyces ziwulingensis TaxID=1045501 RepID=A0ABP9BIZ7_9ACTN
MRQVVTTHPKGTECPPPFSRSEMQVGGIIREDDQRREALAATVRKARESL